MLPKKYRIPKESLIRMGENGRRFASNYFTLTVTRNDIDSPRFAVRVGIAIHKRAVRRNRIKRLFHESMRTILPTITKPIDILCSIKHVSSTETKERITELLEKELKKIL